MQKKSIADISCWSFLYTCMQISMCAHRIFSKEVDYLLLNSTYQFMRTYSVASTILGILCILIHLSYINFIDLQGETERLSHLPKVTQLANSRARCQLGGLLPESGSLCYLITCTMSIHKHVCFLQFAFSGNITLSEFSDVNWLVHCLESLLNVNLCLYYMKTSFLQMIQKATKLQTLVTG